MTAPRVLCFSAYSQNLRAAAFVRSLGELGWRVTRPPSHGPPGSVLELVFTLLPYCWHALTDRADLALGCKPHLNVTLPLWICRLRGLPTWLDVDDLDHAYRDNWLSVVVAFVERPFPRRLQIISYHNELLREYLVKDLRCAPSQLLQIEQGVDCVAASEPIAPSAFGDVRQRYSLMGQQLAVYVAHLNLASDLDVVLAAWRQVGQQVPDSVLLVVGGGPMQAHYEQLAQSLGVAERVRFIGEVPHAQVRVFLGVADVALLYFAPRRVNAYRCSLKLREYAAAGCKIVCNDFGELKQFAHLTYQAGSDAPSLAAMIIRVLHGATDGREWTAKRVAREQWDWPRIMRQAVRHLGRRLGGDFAVDEPGRPRQNIQHPT